MSLHDDLLDHAQRLSELELDIQTEADCRRAVSATYYALFHLVVNEAAPLFATDSLLPESTRERLELQIRRMFTHTEMRGIAENLDPKRDLKAFFKDVLDDTSLKCPPPLRDFAKAFVELQKKRELADYDISAPFSAPQARESVGQARKSFPGLVRREEGTHDPRLPRRSLASEAEQTSGGPRPVG